VADGDPVLDYAVAAGRWSRGVAAQVEIESKVGKRFITFQFRALISRRCQRGFDRVNLHRPTWGRQGSGGSGGGGGGGGGGGVDGGVSGDGGGRHGVSQHPGAYNRPLFSST